jgi:hypothetical protein
MVFTKSSHVLTRLHFFKHSKIGHLIHEPHAQGIHADRVHAERVTPSFQHDVSSASMRPRSRIVIPTVQDIYAFASARTQWQTRGLSAEVCRKVKIVRALQKAFAIIADLDDTVLHVLRNQEYDTRQSTQENSPLRWPAYPCRRQQDPSKENPPLEHSCSLHAAKSQSFTPGPPLWLARARLPTSSSLRSSLLYLDTLFSIGS